MNPPTLLSNGVSMTSRSNCSAIFSGSTGTVRCPSDELTVSKRALTASWKGSFTIAPPTQSFTLSVSYILIIYVDKRGYIAS